MQVKVTNEYNYKVLKSHLQKFQNNIDNFDYAARERIGVDKILVEAELNGLKAIRDEIKEALEEYEKYVLDID